MDIEETITDLHTTLLPLLHRHPHGVDEMELMNQLAATGLPLFAKETRHEPQALFRAHFILFHALYRLRPLLAEQGLDLQIHCLCIRLRPLLATPAQSAGLAEHDGVAAYYLDPANLTGMDNDAVEALIADGLRRASGHDQRLEALAVLGLEPSAESREIRRAYRRLAMRHHPDRGGDTQTLQRINDAYRQLTAEPSSRGDS